MKKTKVVAIAKPKRNVEVDQAFEKRRILVKQEEADNYEKSRKNSDTLFGYLDNE